MDKEKIKEFIDKWNVGYEDKEQQIEFALEMEQDLLNLHQSSDAVQFAKWMLTQVNVVEELYELFKNQNKYKL